jgi:hypothetical protein
MLMSSEIGRFGGGPGSEAEGGEKATTAGRFAPCRNDT